MNIKVNIALTLSFWQTILSIYVWHTHIQEMKIQHYACLYKFYFCSLVENLCMCGCKYQIDQLTSNECTPLWFKVAGSGSLIIPISAAIPETPYWGQE